MSMSARVFKELETKTQDKLYDNIKYLTHIYPTTKDFDAVFKRSMFAKSNKAAFQHVIYYLFNVLNPRLTKEKITAWPLYDIKLEGTFRNEVMGFINYINAHYPHANIPNLMASHLVSPGGLRFVKFMLKLSTLVIYEHLKGKESIGMELLAPIRPHKNLKVTNIIMKKLETNVELIEINTNEKWENFRKDFVAAASEAEEIVDEQAQIENELCSSKKRLEEKKKTLSGNKDKNVLTTKFNSLKEKVAFIERIKDLCYNGGELLTFLSSDKPILDFKKDDFIVPNSPHLFKCNAEKLDLHHLFNSLSVLLENESLEMPILTVNQLNDMTNILRDLNDKCAQLDQKLALRKNELTKLSENFSPVICSVSKEKKNAIKFLT